MSDAAVRVIAGKSVPAIGYGCMCLSHAYAGAPPEPEGVQLLRRAFELGYRHFDTATLYGFGANETLVGKALDGIRHEIFLASKGGMAGVDGKRVIDGRPDTLSRQVDESLKRLRTEHIDLYYLHRWDRSVPIEESVGALARAVESGKIGAIGLSEVSAPVLQKANAEAPIAAVQNEYSIWSRNCEIAVSETCRELGIALVAFSPVCRGFLGIDWASFDSFESGDIRAGMPRFSGQHRDDNQRWLAEFRRLATDLDISASQLALGWLLTKGEHVCPIPGTTQELHLKENFEAGGLRIPMYLEQEIDALMAPESIAGLRYPPATQQEIETEQFEFELAPAA